MGISLRRFQGWEPATTTTHRGRTSVSRPEPEWDVYERAIMLAAHVLDQDQCPGCGDWLSQTLTDKPPFEDDSPFGHRPHKAWCRTCVAHDKVAEVLRKHDEKVRGGVADEHPPARRVWFEHIPIGSESDAEHQEQKDQQAAERDQPAGSAADGSHGR